MSEFAVPDEAVAALDAAMAQDGMGEGNATQVLNVPDDGFDPANVGLPQGETTPNAATPPAGDDTPVATEGSAPAEDSFTDRFDPNSLPPELVPAYKAMQADYTRKRQADAEAVRLAQQFEGVDLNAAVQLFQGIQQPDTLLQFVQEASQWLADQGLVEFEGDPAPETTTLDQNNLSQALAAIASDPELAPLAEAVQALQAQVDNFRHEQSERLEAEREEHAFLQAMGEVQRMENVIRTDNPHYDQTDIDAIYELASHHDGDLLAAQASYEASFARRLGRYMQAKETTPDPVVPTGLPQPTTTPELGYDPLDPKQAHEAALEVLRLIESQSD